MNEDILKVHLKEGRSGKCYLLCGDEEYTKDHYVKQFLKRVENGPVPEFNLLMFSGKSFNVHSVASALEDFPYMSDYKLIFISEVELTKLTDAVVTELLDTLENMPDYANVVILARSHELAPKLLNKKEKAPVSELLNWLDKNGLVINFETQTGAKLKKWVRRHFDAAKTPISDDVVEYIIAFCGEDMYTLHSETGKLIAYCNGREVTKSDVSAVCCANESYRIFDLTKALTAGNTKQVNTIYNNLIKSGASPFAIINMLSSCITDMTVVKAGMENGKTIQEIAKTLKTFDWAVRNYLPYVRKLDYGYLQYAAKKCNECALTLKSTRIDTACAVEFFLLKLAAYEKN